MRHVPRVGGEETDALKPIERRKVAHEVTEIGLFGQVMTVGFDRLAEEGDFTHSVSRQVGDFADDLVHRAALLALQPWTIGT